VGDDHVSGSGTDHPGDVELAGALARDAGRLAAEMLRDGLSTHRKTSVSDVVSAADHAAEKLVAERLAELRPGDGVIGEEGTDAPATSASGRTWLVDPVDGTYNFLSGLPIWCAAVGLRDRDGIVLGAIYQPAADELWVGGRGHPTTCNGVAVEPLPERPLAEVSIASYLHPTTLPDDSARVPFLRAVQGAATVRMLGSGSVELASVAGGRLGCALQLNALDWDWVPGAALVVAAGGESRMFAAHGHMWHACGNRQTVDELELRVRGVADLG
jgi:myo-inositol-1(or 4)-monophosphatase